MDSRAWRWHCGWRELRPPLTAVLGLVCEQSFGYRRHVRPGPLVPLPAASVRRPRCFPAPADVTLEYFHEFLLVHSPKLLDARPDDRRCREVLARLQQELPPG